MRLSTIVSLLAVAAGVVEAGRSLRHVGKHDKHQHNKRVSVPNKNKRSVAAVKPRYLSSATESKSIGYLESFLILDTNFVPRIRCQWLRDSRCLL